MVGSCPRSQFSFYGQPDGLKRPKVNIADIYCQILLQKLPLRIKPYVSRLFFKIEYWASYEVTVHCYCFKITCLWESVFHDDNKISNRPLSFLIWPNPICLRPTVLFSGRRYSTLPLLPVNIETTFRYLHSHIEASKCNQKSFLEQSSQRPQ